MSLTEYHEALQCKIRGTKNLHNASESLQLKLDSFTMLSSLSGWKRLPRCFCRLASGPRIGSLFNRLGYR
jgi:hypothetical protein